jgi:uncharacterized protein (TIGR00730 family)
MEKAYKNLEFLTSRDARTIRILAEYLEPQARFEHYNVKDTVVFFGSARALSPEQAEDKLQKAVGSGNDDGIERAKRAVKLSRYYEDARTLARMLTEWSKGLRPSERRFIVCSGGGPGIMEAANRGASEAQGVSIGLGISLPNEPTINDYITREMAFEFHYFFMRKFWFAYMSKAMVIFPGGFGTLDELCEIMTLVQTGKVDRPLPIVLYGNEYWNEILDRDALVRWGTISPKDLELLHPADTPEQAFDLLKRELTKLYDLEDRVDDDTPPTP